MSVEINTTAKFICNLCDCVSIGNKGEPIVQTIFTKFPYANCYADRVSNMKTIPGTYTVKGDGKKNRYIINMFVQFYPGPSKYPNDNIVKRIEWFTTCLTKLSEMSDLSCISFPANFGKYQTIDYSKKYLETLDDFRKKYYLKHRQVVQLVDYHDVNILSNVEHKVTTYDKPIDVLNLTDVDDYVTETNNIEVSQHINIEQLCYISIHDDKRVVPKEKIVVKKKISNVLKDD